VSDAGIAAVVLAAGLSRRMGQAKLLLPLGGRPVIRLSVEAVIAAGLGPVVVVAGAERAGVEAALAGLCVEIALNPHPESGQASSVRVGVAALRPEPAAALIALGDQPFVPPDVIPALRAALERTGRAIAAPSYRGALGNPVLFRRGVFPELLALAGDRGARPIIDRDPERVAVVSFDVPMPRDLDTPEDYDGLRSAVNPV
jgi:molybdenum cofactor cytidylyltransferase